jgi:hypothetical protein
VRRTEIDVLVQRLLSGVVATALTLATGASEGQSGEILKARLSSLPIDAVTAPKMGGSGSVSAALQGTTLIITGEFKDLGSPATVAHLHRARRGLRGPAAFDLTVTKAESGTIEGKLSLTPNQVGDLKRGWYYVQIHTDKNPEGQLRGWLLP